MRTALSRLVPGLVLLLPGCGRSAEQGETSVVEIDVPGAPGNSRPAVSDGPGERLLLRWVEPVDSDQHRIAYAVLDGSGWSESRTIVQTDDLYTNWADVQQVRPLDGGAVLSTWGKEAGSSALATHLRARIITAGGSPALSRTVHTDTSASQHGFASLAQTDQGPMVVWRDGPGRDATRIHAARVTW